MRISDLDESTLNEFIPLTKKGREIRRAEKAGAADLNDNVTRLTRELAAFLGTQGKRLKTATTDDVIQFLKTKNVDTSDIGTSDPMNPKRIDNIFRAKVQKKMAGQSISAAPAAEPEQDAPKAAPVKVSSAYAQTKKAALGLNAKEKRRLIQQIEKSINSKSTVVDKNFDKSQKLSKFGKVGK